MVNQDQASPSSTLAMTSSMKQTLQNGNAQHNIEMPAISSSMKTTKKKETEIEEACSDSDLDSLVQLADSSGGLLQDSLRRDAWPILLGYTRARFEKPVKDDTWRLLPKHRDEAQVRLDVDRALVYFPKNDSEKTRNARNDQLFDLIVSVLRRHPALCYSQGYHDIAQVLLLVLGQDEAPAALTYLSLLRIRDYTLPALTPAFKHLRLIPAILKQADPSVAAHLSSTDPYFAISATITLYAHEIDDYREIARLFDFILAHEPVMPLYLFAAMVIARRKELLEIDEPDMLHFKLTKIPQPLDLQAYIDLALVIFQAHPPERLPGFVWWRLPSSSVLKTSRSLKTKQSLEDAERIFQLQAKQLEQEKRRQDIQRKAAALVQRNKGPMVSITAALIIGCLAIWVRRSGNDQTIMNLLAGLARSSWGADLVWYVQHTRATLKGRRKELLRHLTVYHGRRSIAVH